MNVGFAGMVEREHDKVTHREREGASEIGKEVGGGRDRGTHGERQKQTPNSLFSLSNSNHREDRERARMEGWGSGGGREEEEREKRRNLRGVKRDSHTFLLQNERLRVETSKSRLLLVYLVTKLIHPQSVETNTCRKYLRTFTRILQQSII